MMSKVIKFEDLKKFKFKKKRGRPAAHMPTDLVLTISWVEILKDGTEIDKVITCNPSSPWETLKLDGKKVVIEKCLQIVGTLYNSDPSLEAELREHLEHLFKDEQ